MKKEVWKWVVGFEGKYKVSTFGNVLSLYSGKGHRKTPMKIHGTPGYEGYPLISLHCQNRCRTRKAVHCLVLEAFRGSCPRGFQGSHLNGIRADNRLSNLIWESVRDNNLRKNAHGTMKRGESHYRAILTEVDVILIKDLLCAGETVTDIAKKLGYRRGNIYNIKAGITWKHLF